MAEDKKKPEVKKEEQALKKLDQTKKDKTDDKKSEDKKMEEKKTEKKTETKKHETVKKDKAVVNGFGIKASHKYSKDICKAISGKDIDKAIEFLELVVKKKRAVRMTAREVGHKPGNIAGGKYPVKAAGMFIDLLKQLKANANVAGIDNPVVSIAMSNKAPRPYRKGGRKGKRAHVHIEAIDKSKSKSKEKKK